MNKWGERYAHKSDAFSASPLWESEADYFINRLPWAGVVVDLGCGTGRFIQLAKKKRPNVMFVGVDVNAYALDVLSERIENAHTYTTLAEVTADIGKADAIVCMHCLPQFESPNAMMGDCWKALKQGGRIHVAVHNKFNDLLYLPINWITGYKSDSTISQNYRLGTLVDFMKDSGFIPQHYGYRDGAGVLSSNVFSKRIYYIGMKAKPV